MKTFTINGLTLTAKRKGFKVTLVEVTTGVEISTGFTVAAAKKKAASYNDRLGLADYVNTIKAMKAITAAAAH